MTPRLIVDILPFWQQVLVASVAFILGGLGGYGAAILKFSNKINLIVERLNSGKSHMEYYDIELDVHETWLEHICSAIRQINVRHENQHGEDMKLNDLLKRPEKK